MKSSLATRKLAVEANAGCCGTGILHLQRPFQERRKPERILGIVPDKRAWGRSVAISSKPTSARRTGRSPKLQTSWVSC